LHRHLCRSKSRCAALAFSWFALPALWADPFAPLLKNLAVVAATLAVLATEA